MGKKGGRGVGWDGLVGGYDWEEEVVVVSVLVAGRGVVRVGHAAGAVVAAVDGLLKLRPSE